MSAQAKSHDDRGRWPLRDRMPSVGRALAIWFVLLAFSSSTAFAGDFVINYAVDANGNIDAGKLESCGYERVCHLRAAALNIEILVHRRTTGLPAIDMVVQGPPDCCYSADADEQFHSTLGSGLLRLAIYRRSWRNRDDFVRSQFLYSERFGIIHLGFSQLR